MVVSLSILSPLIAAMFLLGGCAVSQARVAAPGELPAGLRDTLPPLEGLPLSQAAGKAASDVDYDMLAAAPVMQSASGVDYATGRVSLTPPDLQTMTYAVFAAGIEPPDGSVFPIRLSVAADAPYWVAVSDYSKLRWRFLPYQTGGVYDLAGGAGLLKPVMGAVYVALIAWQTPASFTGLVLTTNGMPGQPLQLWYYLQTNLQVDATLAAEIARLPVAAAAGYTKVLYTDSKLEFIDQAWSHYIDNLQAFDAAAKANGIEVIPALIAPGYADGLLYHDPNLIEGQPVKDCEFVVARGEAQPAQNPATVIVNGDFEDHSGDTFANWNQMDGPGVSTFADPGRGGGTCIRFEDFTAGNPSGNDRIQQLFTVEPWHYYVVHFWLKTQDVNPIGQLWARTFSADEEFRQLTYNTFPLSQTQDWMQYPLIFNSQDKDAVYLYLGIWSGQNGRFWIDDVSIENAGLVNLVRRPGAPFRVMSADGSIEYNEGTDYQGTEGSQVTDVNMGYVAGYGGTYDLWHTPPPIVIPAGSRIANGARLKVSYYHAVFTDDMKSAIALSEEGTYAIAQDLLQVVHDVLDPHMVFIGVDEHRVGGWSEPGFSDGTTTGQLLAQFTARIDAIANGIDPTWRLATWSDMYDPYHNMVPQYYLCKGGTEGAIAGLPAAWDIANWHSFAGSDLALAHFGDHGNRQILSGYYDEGADISIGNWLDQTPGIPGVYAVMYTTWRNDYSQLANFAATVRAWEAAQ